MISLEQCMGADSSHLVSFKQDQQSFLLHPQAVSPWQALCQQASIAGFSPKIASAHRSFSRQLTIWNEKATGLRFVLDSDETPIDISTLSESERVFAILRWSALPGLSRHHWGSEIDIYDASCMPANYKLQLTVEETKGVGVCAQFYLWLDKQFAKDKSFCGFTRPFMQDNGGIAIEPWHLSLLEVASISQALVNKKNVYEFIAAQNIELKDTVLRNFDEIFERFVCS